MIGFVFIFVEKQKNKIGFQIMFIFALRGNFICISNTISKILFTPLSIYFYIYRCIFDQDYWWGKTICRAFKKNHMIYRCKALPYLNYGLSDFLNFPITIPKLLVEKGKA